MTESIFNVKTKRIRTWSGRSQGDEIEALRESVYDFIVNDIIPNVHNKRVLEIGPATSPQGGQEQYFVDIKKRLLEQGNEYKSCDISPNSGADIIGDVTAINRSYDTLKQYDVIIALEVLEHVEKVWEVSSLFNWLLDEGGRVYVSTPFTFLQHDPKPDYWRFTENGMESLFGHWFDCELTKVLTESDGARALHMRLVGTKK